MLEKNLKILFFLAGDVATKEEQLEVRKLNYAVQYRNAQFAGPELPFTEHCDGVAGSVPSHYAEKYPKAEDLIKELRENLLSEEWSTKV